LLRFSTYLCIAAFLTGLTVASGAVNSETSDSTSVTSGNPIITHIRSADPAAEVWNDGQVWVYASHDQEDAVDYSSLDGYHVFSSYDLVNWTDHGEILHSRDVSWGNPDGGWMFAPDAAYKDGTYYFYFPHLSNEWKWRIGVATSTAPEGPFTDVGHFIEGTDNIDPTCFMDDDGQAYLLWGGGGETPKIARLRENMTELAEAPRPIVYGADNFGEGGYMHKHNGIYYFSYTCNTCWPYQGFYAMGESPYGPFEYKGPLNPNPPGAQDHHSIIEYHGQSYYFYHVGNYGLGGSIYRRNICIDSLYYNEDGTMREVKQTTTGVGIDPIGMTPGKIVPGRFEAWDHFRSEGVTGLLVGDSAYMVAQIGNGDWFDYVLDILGTETYTARMQVSDVVAGTRIYFLVDEMVSDSVRIETDTTLITFPLFLFKGKHTLKFLFRHSEPEAELMKVAWIELRGEKEYFSIDASVKGGGSFQPGGISYFERGDTAEFRLDAAFNYILDTVWIDGIQQALADSYTFYDISENHVIRASFTECEPVESTPSYLVNEGNPVYGTGISVTEGDQLILKVVHDSTSVLTWTGPNGLSTTDSIIVLDSISVMQKGTYVAVLMNKQGCVTEHAFQVSVAYMELDVYEAEQFFNQSGINLGTCHDVGGGKYVGYIEDNDYCYYSLSIDEPGYYEVTARVSTALEGGTIEITARDSLVATIQVDGSMSGGWDQWVTTEPVEAGFDQGVQILKFTFKGGEGYLFNFNWFDLAFNRPFVSDTATGTGIALKAYPNPFVTGTNIVFTLKEASTVDLRIFHNNGALVSTLFSNQILPPGTYSARWTTDDGDQGQLPDGVYILRLQSDLEVITQKLILTH
jgi:arabinoxylan arabinofuranohydrolase